jgi:hypothetical protein
MAKSGATSKPFWIKSFFGLPQSLIIQPIFSKYWWGGGTFFRPADAMIIWMYYKNNKKYIKLLHISMFKPAECKQIFVFQDLKYAVFH